MKEELKKKASNDLARFLLVAIAFVLAAWLVLGFGALYAKTVIGWFSPGAAESIEPGTFGDMFGAANALFSALAFAAVIITLYLQMEELKEARLDRKANLEHQEVIARSQEAAAKMQLKVAQSGDVLQAFHRVSGSDFVNRIERLRWVAANVGTAAETPGDYTRRFEYDALRGINTKDPSQVPMHYRATRVPPSEIRPATGVDEAIADRVINDVLECLDAVVDLRPVITLHLLSVDDVLQELSPADCEFIANCARAVAPAQRRQTQTVEWIGSLLEYAKRGERHPDPDSAHL